MLNCPIIPNNDLCCNNIMYENKNKYIQRDAVIMESYTKWKALRKEQFVDLCSNDFDNSNVIAQNVIADYPSNDQQWWKKVLT